MRPYRHKLWITLEGCESSRVMYVLDPLHDYAIVHALPDVMQRIAVSNPDAPLPTLRETGKIETGRGQTGRLIIPDSYATDGVGADSGTSAKRGEAVTTLLAGRVLAVGPGKHREGMFIAPTIKPRDVVLFMPRTVSYSFSVHGRSIKIVPYHELVATMREVAVTSPEWVAFLALVEGAAANDSQQSAAEAV